MDEDLFYLTLEQMKTEVLRLRSGIRKHRDQRFDDRCWMDDIELYEILPERADLRNTDIRLLPKEVMMRNCDHYTTCRTLTATPEEALAMYKALSGGKTDAV